MPDARGVYSSHPDAQELSSQKESIEQYTASFVMDLNDRNDLMKTWEDVLKLLQTRNAGEIDEWTKRLRKVIKSLEQLLLVPTSSVSEKQKHLFIIGFLRGIEIKLGCLLKRGKGLINLPEDRVQWTDLLSAFKERIKTGVITNLKHVDISSFLQDCLTLFQSQIKSTLKSDRNVVKVYAVLAAKFMVLKNDEEIVEMKYFNTKAEAIYPTTRVRDWFIKNVQEPIKKEIEEFELQDSGWTLHSIVNLTVNISKFNPMRGSSYVRLPSQIRMKNACINVKNSDSMCFKWALLSALHPSNHPDRVSMYSRYKDDLNFTGIDFPVMPNNISKFEKHNDLSINVYILKKRIGKFETSPLHVTSAKKNQHVNLLLIQDHYVTEEEGEEEKDVSNVYQLPRFHYVWIKDLSRLVATQLSKRAHKHHICDRCLHYFRNETKLAAHNADCQKINKCKIKMPTSRNKMLFFKNHCNKERVPFIVYADFECLLKPTRDENVYQKHEAFSVGYYVKCSYDDSKSRYCSYRGAKPADWFVKELQRLAAELEELRANPKTMNRLTLEQMRQFRTATTCHICRMNLPTNDRVHDHCHLTGQYRGSAHNDCNLRYQDSRVIPVVFHNLTGYDAHFIIREIATCFDGRVDILPQTKERYIAFTKHIDGSDVSFRFIDSFRFMASSLEKLASYLTDLKIVRHEFPQLSAAKFQLLTRKGIFPYEYVDDMKKLDEKNLPTQEDFHSTLNDSDISVNDYEHAKNVWQEFGIRDLGEYSDLYLKTDVLLLADVFENFRDNCSRAYDLDPAHYYTAPGFTWDAMLKYTKIELELFTDLDMHMFVERGVRGGVSQCCNRYARANNKYMKDYATEKPDKYLMYYDVNNLYGWAMMQSLPYGGFVWVENLEEIDICKVADDSLEGYILEVDLDYPASLHDSHQDLPLCPEHKNAPDSAQTKLMTTLDAKSRYILHYRTLKQALKYGLKLRCIHRVLKFKQRPKNQRPKIQSLRKMSLKKTFSSS